MVKDPAADKDLVKLWMWFPGLILTIICVCVVMGVEFDMPVGMSLLSLSLAFFFSFLANQCSGATGGTTSHKFGLHPITQRLQTSYP